MERGWFARAEGQKDAPPGQAGACLVSIDVQIAPVEGDSIEKHFNEGEIWTG
jgi:hypothetical protein